MRVQVLLILTAAIAAQAAITVPPEPTETNPPPGSIVVPPPRGTPSGEKPMGTSTNAPAVPGVPQLVVSLVDGSKLRGTTTLKALTLRSEALGKLTVPLERIRQVKFSKDRESVTLTLHNGDRLQAGLADTTLALTTVFGPVTVPLNKATEIQVQAAIAGHNIEWEAMPFPAVQWSGSRGECVLIEADGLLLQGQPLRGSQTFRAPVTVTCEITPERLHIGNTALFVEFIPTGLAKDADVVKTPGARRFFVYTGESHSIGWQCLQEGRWQAVWSDNLPALKVNEPHRLEIQVGPEQLRVRMDGKEYDAGKVPGPPEEFQIQLWNWQPDSRWRVRNVTVR